MLRGRQMWGGQVAALVYLETEGDLEGDDD